LLPFFFLLPRLRCQTAKNMSLEISCLQNALSVSLFLLRMHIWSGEGYGRGSPSILRRRQRPQDFRSSRPTQHRLVFTNLSVPEYQHSFCELRDVMLVRNQHNGQAFVVQILEDFHDLHRRTAVQIARRFIGQQDCRAVHQSARHRHSLLLPTGHLRREMPHSVRGSLPCRSSRTASAIPCFPAPWCGPAG